MRGAGSKTQTEDAELSRRACNIYIIAGANDNVASGIRNPQLHCQRYLLRELPDFEKHNSSSISFEESAGLTEGQIRGQDQSSMRW